MSSIPFQILDAFNVAQIRAGERLPYTLGGGHDPKHPFQPSGNPRGYDCSGAASDVVNRVSHLGHAMTTGELLTTKALLDGEGRYFTLWIAQYPGVIEHCACEFKLPEEPVNRWFVAAHTGTRVGWFDLPDNWVKTPFAYIPRRRP